jgi:uncharacterized membrane protein YeaQ/YmgE (transglycosylase-associated protein family)
VVCYGFFLLSAYLASMISSSFTRRLRRPGISEKVVYGVLGIAVALYLWRFRSIIGRRTGPLLLLAFGLLGSAVIADALLERWLWSAGRWLFFVEDGLKWLGITSGCAFCFAWCRDALLVRLR